MKKKNRETKSKECREKQTNKQKQNFHLKCKQETNEKITKQSSQASKRETKQIL